MRILIVEDDGEVNAFIARNLIAAGYEVDTAADGGDGLAKAELGGYDAWIVDRMLPGIDGLSLIAALRQKGDATPAMILSALGDVDDRVKGLRAGGDDYLVKPFALAELLARIDVMVRRNLQAVKSRQLEAGDLRMDLINRTVVRGDVSIPLYSREFALLEFLLKHRGQVVTRAMLLEGVWDYHFDPQTNVIDVHISRLRAKVDKGFAEPLIETVRGAGYRIG